MNTIGCFIYFYRTANNLQALKPIRQFKIYGVIKEDIYIYIFVILQVKLKEIVHIDIGPQMFSYRVTANKRLCLKFSNLAKMKTWEKCTSLQ